MIAKSLEELKMIAQISENSEIEGLSKNWDFTPSKVLRWERRMIAEEFLRSIHRAPKWLEIKEVKARPTWIVYFLYTADGALSPAHKYTLARLRDMGLPVLAVCATSDPKLMPQALLGFCDALFWKALPGYDFSAYALALRQISRYSPNADVYVMNDSMLGPFSDFRADIASSRWELTGFTASNQITNHIQSYAFFLRNVNQSRMMRLLPVFCPFVSISHRQSVINLQELRFARVASRSMSVGALWYTKNEFNPTLLRPIELLNAGFPFLKKSLFGISKSLIDQNLLLSRLEKYGHPLEFGSS
jgi:lipopolysaccharide biosynthesis protein